jgi:phenylacetate-CoA ligase
MTGFIADTDFAPDFVPSAGSETLSTRQFRDMFAQSPHWDAETWTRYQRLQLGQLLRHAKANVPFYQSRLDAVLRPDGSLDWDRWHEIPIVRREDLRDKRADMLSKVVPPTHGKVGSVSSSGSTGTPVQVTVPELFILVATFGWSRLLVSHGFNPADGFTEFKALLPTGKPMTTPVLTFPAKNSRGPRTWINRSLSNGEKLELLQAHGVGVLGDTPNHAEVLARENLRRDVPITLSAIIGIGMKISEEQEELFRKSFGARTLSPYSSKEGSLMASQCAVNRDTFHISSELVLLEVVDDFGRPVADGVQGRCIITPFFNSAAPLIRYDQGDLVIRGTLCGCGAGFPVLTKISGRADAIFRFPGKHVALARFDDNLVQTALRADAYQFAQVAPERIIVRYVSNQDAGPDDKQRVCEHLLKLLNVNVEIAFERVAIIPFNAGGKQQRITREFQ